MLAASVREIAITPMGFAVIVKPDIKDKIIPIFIGPTEAYAISTVLQDEEIDRPVTADLLHTVINATGSAVKKVFVHDFRGGTFFAKVYITGKSFPTGFMELTARPSDAIALAVRFASPIYVSEHVYEHTAIDIATLRNSGPAATSPETDDVDDILTADEREEFFEAILEEFGEKKKPKQSKKKIVTPTKYLSRHEVLQQMLKTALAHENYEEAAKLRDQLRLEPLT